MFASLSRFAYLEPASELEALALLAEHGGRARVLAGGCDLLPELRRRRSRPELVLSIARIGSLDRLELDGRGLRIRAMASLRSVELTAGLRQRFAALHEGIRSIASVQVKTTGTLVGNLCVATPASDLAPPLMVHGATLRVARAGGERSLPLGGLFAGPKRHTLAEGELVTEVLVPPAPAGSGSAFAKLTRTAADIAKLNVAALLVVEENLCTEARIVLGAVAPVPVHALEAERLLVGSAPSVELIARAASAAAEAIRPISDLRSTSGYRRSAARVLVRRVLEAALARATGERGAA